MYRSLLQEPLVYFMLLASLLFSFNYFYSRDDKEVINITQNIRSSIVNNETNLKGGKLSQTEQESAIKDYIDEQVLLDEAYRLGLDDDQIIRTRLLNKVRYVLTVEQPEPTEVELLSYYQKNKDDFIQSDVRDIEQVYFSSAQQVPEDLSDQLNSGELATGFGEEHSRFPRQLIKTNTSELSARFGSNVSNSMNTSVVGYWVGPIESPHGVHFVRVVKVHGGIAKPFSEVETYVRSAYKNYRKNIIVGSKVKALTEGYAITVFEPATL